LHPASARTRLSDLRAAGPGLVVCGVVAAAAAFLGQHYGAPVMLFALLLGLALNFLGQHGPCVAGIDLAARTVLRAGVALLGLRISAEQLVALGWPPVLLVGAAVVLTIAVSMLAARLLGFHSQFGLLSGGATAICGASAAMALSAALPAHPLKERATLFTVVGVSALSTMAMVAYPVLAQALGLDERAAGIFYGATIHDVAQVVGAGYSHSAHSGDVATVVKLLRVAMLVPVMLFAVWLNRQAPVAGTERPPLLPGFVLAFVALATLNSLHGVPAALQQAGGEASRACLVVAIAAIGMKTQLKDLLTVGWKPVLLMLGETAFLAALVLVALRWL